MIFPKEPDIIGPRRGTRNNESGYFRKVSLPVGLEKFEAKESAIRSLLK